MKIRRSGGGLSPNISDRRGQSSGSSGMRMPLGVGGGISGIILMLILLFMGGGLGGLGGGSGSGTGIDIGSVLEQLPRAAPPGSQAIPQAAPGAADQEDVLAEFVSFVLDDVQGFWDEKFREAGQRYEPAQLVLFTDAVGSGCGSASSETGPFYCSIDRSAYLDLNFFVELERRFGARGDFAQAYVIAHEIAHHIQNITGISASVRKEQQANPRKANDLSIRQELQADCLAGVWAFSTYQRGLLEEGDLEEGLGAAAAVGDDRIQKQATGRVNPETWTHGSSAQRVKWFKKGYESGEASSCDTFAGGI